MADDLTERDDAASALSSLALSDQVATVTVEVVDGPDRGTRQSLDATQGTIGTNERNALRLSDPKVSRFHCEVFQEQGVLGVRDLDSTNGTFLDGVRIREAWLRAESQVRVGDSTLTFAVGEPRERRISARARFGGLVGRSVAMRAVFAQLEKAAPTEATVLLTGETGTGKEEAALALHDHSPRADGPFVTVDCGALSASLVESELFGHVRGAYTGAHTDREGAFEAADGGTLFLDELGELPLALQSRLLGVLERRSVRRVGETEDRAVDVRVVAATHRDLRADVNAGRFREDLFYRLAVIEVELPPLRRRPEDLAVLAQAILARVGEPGDEAILDDAMLAALRGSTWPGNVRQLRNYLVRARALGADAVPPAGPPAEPQDPTDPALRYDTARALAIDAFERRYVQRALDAAGGSVSAAARRAGMNRSYLHRLLRKWGLRG